MGRSQENFLARASKRWLFRIAELHLRTATSESSIVSGTRKVTMTLIALVVAASIVLIPSFRSVADEFEAHETLLTALGATYGTVIALVLTLSVIPVERAGEAWSASIVRLYRHDPGTYLTFVWLGVCCVASFVLAVEDLGNFAVSSVLAASFLVSGISLDVLRGYHSHVCKLLDPEHAVDVGLKKAKGTVDRLNRVVARNARLIAWRPFAEEEPRPSSRLVKSNLYLRMPGYPGAIVDSIDDLAEMARKAIARGERPLARAAVPFDGGTDKLLPLQQVGEPHCVSPQRLGEVWKEFGCRRGNRRDIRSNARDQPHGRERVG